MFRFKQEYIRKRIWLFPPSLGFFDCEPVAMVDALSVVPAAVLRNLADKLYEKRKNAALEVPLPSLLLLLF